MQGTNLLDWIMNYFLPIFIDSNTLNNALIGGVSVREFVASWIVILLFAMPTLAIYFGIKRGKRLL